MSSKSRFDRLASAVEQHRLAEVRAVLAERPGLLAEHPSESARLLALAIQNAASRGKLHLLGPSSGVVASVEGERGIVDALLEAGLDPNGGDPAAISPLHQAILTAYVPFVATLLERGADPNRVHPTFGPLTALLEYPDESPDKEILALLRAAGADT